MVALYLERRPELTLPLLLSSLIFSLHLWGSRLVCTLDYAGQIRKTSFLDVPKTESQTHSLVFALCFIRIQKCSVCMCCDLTSTKGQLISKANCQAANSSKKWTNEFVFTSMRHVFVCFLEELDNTKRYFEIIWPLGDQSYNAFLKLYKCTNNLDI